MNLQVRAPGNAREPCPDRILDDVGLGFAIGAIGGGAWHFVRGLKNSPTGSRLLHASQFVHMNAPRTAGTFAVWGGVFDAAECGLVYFRRKEDPWNSIISGAFTGGFLQMRQGFGPASRSALLGGVLLALVEGLNIAVTKIEPLLPKPEPEDAIPMGFGMDRSSGIKLPENSCVPLDEDAAVAAVAAPSSSFPSSSSSWFGWGGGKKSSRTGVVKKMEVLESSSNAPMPPTFDFK